MTEIKISVLIPTTGLKQSALIELLQQITNQDFKNNEYEVLVVLNGKNSFPSHLFAKANFKFMRIEKKGVNEARLYGMQQARGEIILMLDDDVCLPDVDYFNKILRAHKSSLETLAMGGFYKSAKGASVLDRIYNLDSCLSLLASRRGQYSVDLLGGCVSYKRKKLNSFDIWPNSKLAYGASESEFHHRLFQAGALLKLDSSLNVIHKPEMSLQAYCRKAYLQGRGFKNFCRIQNGPKKKLKLSRRPRFILWLRELFFSWGKGDFVLAHPLIPIRNFVLKVADGLNRFFSDLKWGAYKRFNERLYKRRSVRQNHYPSLGTVLLSNDEKLSDPILHLNHTWSQGIRREIGRGFSILSLKNSEFLCLDVSFGFAEKDIKSMIEDYPNLPVALCCLNEKLTPYEIRRNQKAVSLTLQKLKYKNGIRTFVPVESERNKVWPDPKLVWTSRVCESDIKFSIVIPFYNHKDLLIKVIQSLYAQDYSRAKYEIVLVSDGSDDSELEAVLQYARSLCDLSISLIQWDKTKEKPKEFRAGMARQIGSFYARGEFLSFLDSDILIPPTYLSKLESALSIYDIVQCKRRMLDQKITDKILQTPEIDFEAVAKNVYEEDSYWENFKASQEWESLWAFWKYTCTYSLSLSRKNFFNLGGFRPQYNQYGFEDVDLGYRGFLTGLRFGFALGDVFHLYPQGVGTVHHFDSQQREQLLVKSCETFYRLNLSPALFEEFDFFLQGRRFDYQTLKPSDLAYLLWWKGYFLGVQHNLRMSFQKNYYQYVHSLVVKPYYFLSYQWNKRVLRQTASDREDNSLLLLKK